MNKRIVIFGKNGQVSSNLIKLLEAKNADFTAYSSKEANFSNLEFLKDFLKNLTPPDIIINAAAYTNVDGAEDEQELADVINHKAVKLIADYCAKNKVKLIHYSTDYVFDGSGNEPFAADNTKNLNPLNIYGKTKLLGEQAIQESGCEYLIFRISWIWDKNPHFKNFYNAIKGLAKKMEVLTIIDDQVGSPTSAEFVAKNTIKIIERENFQSGIYHLNNGEFMSWYDFALKIISELKDQGEDLKVKEIKPIKTSQYKTKATRPLNSKLESNV